MRRITSTQAADALAVTAWTVRSYAKVGLLAAVTTSGHAGRGQRMYFDPDEVAAFARGGAPAARAYREHRAAAAMPRRPGRGRPAV